MAMATSSSPPASNFESPISQVSESYPPAPPPLASQYYIPSSRRSHNLLHGQTVILDLHGTRFELERDTLINLPESILVVMFPNGLLLRPPGVHPPVPTASAAALSSTSAAASPSSAMQPVSSADAAAVGAAVAIAGMSVGAGGTGAVAGTRAVTGSRLVASDGSSAGPGSGLKIPGHNTGEGDHSNILTTPADPDPSRANATNTHSSTSTPSVATSTAASIGVSGTNSGGIASIGLSPVVAPLLRSGQHHYHPSESTSYTDYSDYSDYSYDDFDDDEEYDDEYDDDGGTRYQVHEDLDDDDDDDDNTVLRRGPQEPEVITVDFDPDCLRYILGFYDEAKRAGNRVRLQRLQAERAHQLQRLQLQQQLQMSLEARIGDHSRDQAGASTLSTSPSATQRNPLVSYSSTSSSTTSSSDIPAALNSLAPQDPLQDKQAIIVLREELDYFAIPPPSSSTISKQDRPKPTPATIANTGIKSAATGTEAKIESEKDIGDDSASSSRQSVEEEPPLLGRTPSMTAASVAATLKAKMFSRGKGKIKGTTLPASGSKPTDPRVPSPPPPPPPPKDFIPSSSPLLLAAGSTSAWKRVPSPPLPPPPLPPQPFPSPLLIKTQCGEMLVSERRIFAALQRNIEKAKNKAEQHLMDMLCVSGFDRQGQWGYRQLQPQRTTVISVAMVTLKTTASSPTIPISTVSGSSDTSAPSSHTIRVQTESEILEQMRLQEQMDRNQMAIAQKLLLFWRKPARKCWWDRVEVQIDRDPVLGYRNDKDVSAATTTATAETRTGPSLSNVDINHSSDFTTKVPIKLWARRTWTLELVLV